VDDLENEMSEQPKNLKYTKSHEWVRDNGDGTVTVGISDHAQEQLGDLVFVELPEAGATLSAGDACAVVESVKAASDVYAPLSGEVVEGNPALADAPETVNQDAYGDGWLFTLRLSQPEELAGLMDAAAYDALVAEEE
jgi:glycine cleavage system H protein